MDCKTITLTPGDIDFVEEMLEFFQDILDAVRPGGDEDE